MAVIGSKTVSKEGRKYFYKITRNSDNDLILSVVEVFNSQGESIVLNDSTVESAESQHVFQGFNTDYTYVNVDASKELIDEALGVSQYKVRNENITYFVNNDGNLIARLNT
jgi:hypothetical protein